MNKCKKPSRKTASKAGKLLRKKISSKDVKTLAGYTLQAASRRGKVRVVAKRKENKFFNTSFWYGHYTRSLF